MWMRCGDPSGCAVRFSWIAVAGEKAVTFAGRSDFSVVRSSG
jgi:hypothetical protein